MPMPKSAFTVSGGCNCRAVRYTISIPDSDFRVVVTTTAPFEPPSELDSIQLTLPFAAIDYCNDCRSATGAIMPMWLCVPASMITATCLRVTSDERTDTSPSDLSLRNNTH